MLQERRLEVSLLESISQFRSKNSTLKCYILPEMMEFYKFLCPHYMNMFEKTGAGCNKTCCTHLLVNSNHLCPNAAQLDLYPLLDDLLLIGTLYGWWWVCAHVSETQQSHSERVKLSSQWKSKSPTHPSAATHECHERERYLEMTSWVLYSPKAGLLMI